MNTRRYWTPERVSEIRALAKSGLSRVQVRARLGLTSGQLAGVTMRENIHWKRSYTRTKLPAPDATGTIFASHVVAPRQDRPVLKPGKHSNKLGTRVSKGAWAGMPIYSLTLEERATCPTSCEQWRTCYGNNLGWAVRWKHGPALVEQLEFELSVLQARRPDGFVVRLHILGDFYSVAYVRAWERWLAQFPALRVFGYTAWPDTSPIGRAVAEIREQQWDRFAVRTSGAPTGPRTFVIERLSDAPAGTIVCPAQTGKSQACATCALCWAARDKPIAFLRH